MPIVGGILNTQGGARRNAKAQVVQPDYSPIPRLYSAGEFGSVYGFLYNGGGNVGECMAFGRIAGRNAAAETPWS
jgi:succinate dehydrogenase/fumarate reductase flavoprotein subunit